MQINSICQLKENKSLTRSGKADRKHLAFFKGRWSRPRKHNYKQLLLVWCHSVTQVVRYSVASHVTSTVPIWRKGCGSGGGKREIHINFDKVAKIWGLWIALVLCCYHSAGLNRAISKHIKIMSVYVLIGKSELAMFLHRSYLANHNVSDPV